MTAGGSPARFVPPPSSPPPSSSPVHSTSSPSISHTHTHTPTPSPSVPPYAPPPPSFHATAVLHGHTKPVSQVRISPDGRWIASSSADGTLKIWDAATGAHTDTLVGHLAGVNCVAWAPDSRTLASGSDDKAIRLWDRVTGRPMLTARGVIASQHRQRMESALLHNADGNNNASIATAADQNELATLSLRIMDPLIGHHSYVHCLAFSPKGNIIASGSYDEAVFLWDVRAGRLMRSLPAHSDPVSGIDFSPDGTLVVSCSTDGLTRVWDATTGQCLRTLVHEDNPPVANVCFSPNGRFVLAFSLDNCIRLWDYVAGKPKKTYQGHRNEKYALGGQFGTLRLPGGRTYCQEEQQQKQEQEEQDQDQNQLAYIASASEDGAIVLWDVKTKVQIQRLRAHDGVCIWVDVHGDTLVSCGLDKTIRIFKRTPTTSSTAAAASPTDQTLQQQQQPRALGTTTDLPERRAKKDSEDGSEEDLL